MAYNVHIKTADGGIKYQNADSYGLKEHGIFWVQVGEDVIHFSPGYWWQYAVDPETDDDPLDLDDIDDLDDQDDEEDEEDV